MTDETKGSCRRNIEYIEELDGSPFDLKPGAKGRWLLWWAEEKTWIASFPSLVVAQCFIIGDPYKMPYNPGWDRSNVVIDIEAALYRQWKKTGKCPQFEFSEASNIFDLYVPLGLGLEALARHVYYDVSGYEVCQQLIDEFCPLVARCLSGGDWGLDANTVDRVAPIATGLIAAPNEGTAASHDDLWIISAQGVEGAQDECQRITKCRWRVRPRRQH
jgi:hypothetical protein